MDYVIEIENGLKKYESFELGPINLKIPKGCIIGLIGENGAGKTTLIKSVLNVLSLDQGKIKIFSQDSSEDFKDEIGIVLDNAFLPEILYVKDVSTILKNIYSKWDETLFQKYLKDFKVPWNAQIKKLSKGMRKKLEIASSLAHHPKLLILDEPTSGLDPVVRNEILDLFLEFIEDEEHTILISTHITSDLENIADKIIFINEGQVILDEFKDTIHEEYGILKCGLEDFDNLDKKEIIAYKKKKYDYEILIKNKEKMKNKYKDFVIDNVTLEDLMVFMIKGAKTW